MTAVFAVGMLMISACTGGDVAEPEVADLATSIPARLAIGDATTAVYNSPQSLALGRHRLILKGEAADGLEYGGPDLTTSLLVGRGETSQVVETEWVWTSEGFSGFYKADVTFDEAGEWTAQLTSPEGEAEPVAFQVQAVSPVPATGQAAIPSPTKTLDNFEVEELTTDPDPELRLYQQSLADALASGRPSVLIFATPAFCRTAVCGPIVDEVATLVDDYPDVNFVHVEVYEPLDNTDGELIPVQAVVEWQLPSEPWVFVIDDEGAIASAFEGFLTREEVVVALDNL